MEHQVNCHYCGGVESVEATTTLFCDYRSATPVIVENVPAYVCELCGDTSFSGETVATLKTIDNGTSRPVGRRSFPVFDFEQPDPKLQPIDAEDLPQLFFNPTPPLVAWKDRPFKNLRCCLARRQYLPPMPYGGCRSCIYLAAEQRFVHEADLVVPLFCMHSNCLALP